MCSYVSFYNSLSEKWQAEPGKVVFVVRRHNSVSRNGSIPKMQYVHTFSYCQDVVGKYIVWNISKVNITGKKTHNKAMKVNQ